jgi:hypothetical protein
MTGSSGHCFNYVNLSTGSGFSAENNHSVHPRLLHAQLVTCFESLPCRISVVQRPLAHPENYADFPTHDFCHGQIWRNFTSPSVQMRVHFERGRDAHVASKCLKGGAKHDRWFSPLFLPSARRAWSCGAEWSLQRCILRTCICYLLLKGKLIYEYDDQTETDRLLGNHRSRRT